MLTLGSGQADCVEVGVPTAGVTVTQVSLGPCVSEKSSRNKSTLVRPGCVQFTWKS